MTRRGSTLRPWLLIAAGVVVGYGIHAWVTRPPQNIAGAIGAGRVAATSAFGGAGSPSTITVTRTPGTSGELAMRVPAGTVLYAGDAAVQRVMTAIAVTIAMPAQTDTMTVQVKTFCLDEFAAIPQANTPLSLSPGPGDSLATTQETEPLHKLADCMAGMSGSDDDKQLAVWAVKDDLLHRSPADALGFLGRRFEESIARELRAKVERAREAIAREAKHLSADEIDAQIAESLRGEEAANRTEAARLARNQLDSLLQHRELLTSCGYAADMPLFR
jgi:hypothetical protein